MVSRASVYSYHRLDTIRLATNYIRSQVSDRIHGYAVMIYKSTPSALLIQIDVIEHYRLQAEREIDRVLYDRVASVKLGAAGIGGYTGVSVINIYHRFLDGHKLVVVSCLGELL